MTTLSREPLQELRKWATYAANTPSQAARQILLTLLDSALSSIDSPKTLGGLTYKAGEFYEEGDAADEVCLVRFETDFRTNTTRTDDNGRWMNADSVLAFVDVLKAKIRKARAQPPASTDPTTTSREVMNPPADEAEAGNLANTAPRQPEHDGACRGETGMSSCPEARPVTATARSPASTDSVRADLIKRMTCLALELPEPVWESACRPVIAYLQRPPQTMSAQMREALKDAERYRYFRSRWENIYWQHDAPQVESEKDCNWGDEEIGAALDRAIDAALLDSLATNSEVEK
jgi:hypothetical protein